MIKKKCLFTIFSSAVQEFCNVLEDDDAFIVKSADKIVQVVFQLIIHNIFTHFPLVVYIVLCYNQNSIRTREKQQSHTINGEKTRKKREKNMSDVRYILETE